MRHSQLLSHLLPAGLHGLHGCQAAPAVPCRMALAKQLCTISSFEGTCLHVLRLPQTGDRFHVVPTLAVLLASFVSVNGVVAEVLLPWKRQL